MTASTEPKGNDSTNDSGARSITPLANGLYVPTVAFFTPEDTIDVDTTSSHTKRLVEAGVAGLLTHGSNGEAVHLDHAERQLINRITRSALDASGKSDIPLIVGCGSQSTRETIQLCVEAAESGGTHALILPPAYYGSLLTGDLIMEHFRAVADASPIPLLVYNFPAACSGLDLSSDTILALAKHSNIVGVKLTCGNTGKLARIVAGTKGTAFRTFGGSADFTIQTLAVGGHGVIAGLGNVAPRACTEIMRLWKEGKTDDATLVQEIVARGDWAAIKGALSLEAQLAEFAELIETEKQMATATSAASA
ncbi:Dihydrodipicolinate synthase-like [Cladobotryum mycophilum]|uniref:Dihydrodipicolinate synthase-like n=1 Tax=Cladobotryum mycophilum TaxID=491253 RepID=A0ABR0SKN3_9HYPO